jgi:hypothetical protein
MRGAKSVQKQAEIYETKSQTWTSANKVIYGELCRISWILIWYNYNQVIFLAMTSTLKMHIKVNAFHTLLVKLRKIHVN